MAEIKPIWKRVFVNAFIVFHIIALGLWGLPTSPFRQRLTRPFHKYVLFTGLWHSWDMFAPTPLMVNFDVVAEITYSNGGIKTWHFPRPEKMSHWRRMNKERWRKWRERVRSDSYEIVWDDTSRFVARKFWFPTNPPVAVKLIRRWDNIPQPLRTDHQPIPPEYQKKSSFEFHEYKVKREDAP
ncbi:MAG: hypothetical protein SFY81_13705 [Verrucomicrobiota bacterium]|nr:hypothetical protein [Verrucomicrobiota bacterium]